MRRWILAALALAAGISINLFIESRRLAEVRQAEQLEAARIAGREREYTQRARSLLKTNPQTSDEPEAAPATYLADSSGGRVAAAAFAEVERAQDPAAGGPPLTLEQLAAGKLKIVDLAWPLNAQSAFWPGENYKPFELHAIATLEKDGVSSKAFSTPEHLGTHLDAPNHFERNQPAVDQIRAEDFFAPGVVIDVSTAATADADYRLTLADVEAWEARHGQIPSGAVVLLLTGWGRHWGDAARYQNKDVAGRLHFPGFSAEAVTFLLDKRRVKGIGLDTMSIDYGLSRDFIVHHLVGSAGRYGLENVAHLDGLPPRGFFLVVAPIKIETGTGGPTRIFAILENDKPSNEKGM